MAIIELEALDNATTPEPSQLPSVVQLLEIPWSMTATLDLRELEEALDTATAQASQRPSAQVQDNPSKRLPGPDCLDLNTAREAAERAYRHQASAARDHGRAGADAYSNWAHNNFTWTADDYRKLGFHQKYCKSLYLERANAIFDWIHSLNQRYSNLMPLIGANTIVFDLGCGPGCCTLGYAAFVAHACECRPAFKAFGLDTALEWHDGYDALESFMSLDCNFLFHEPTPGSMAGVSLQDAPKVIESIMDPPADSDPPCKPVARETSIVIIISHVFKDFPPSRSWWQQVENSLDGRSAIILVLDRLGGHQWKLPGPSVISDGKIRRSIAGATFMNFVPTEHECRPRSPRSSRSQASASSTPSCPKCSARMVQRFNRAGGRDFWGCPYFPRCLVTQSL